MAYRTAIPHSAPSGSQLGGCPLRSTSVPASTRGVTQHCRGPRCRLRNPLLIRVQKKWKVKTSHANQTPPIPQTGRLPIPENGPIWMVMQLSWNRQHCEHMQAQVRCTPGNSHVVVCGSEGAGANTSVATMARREKGSATKGRGKGVCPWDFPPDRRHMRSLS